jgi:transcriptional regulator with XRE-family HTH domain
MVEDEPERPGLPSLDTLADRLEYLFDKVRPVASELAEGDEPGRRYNNREIADKINHAGRDSGVSISAAYVGELRRGVASDPRTSHVRALAAAFGVDPGYFVDDKAAERVRDQITLLNELRRMDVKQVALRRVLADTGLSPASAVLIEQMVARLREVEEQATQDDARAEPTDPR